MSGITRVTAAQVDDALRLLLRKPTSYFWRLNSRAAAAQIAATQAKKAAATNAVAIKANRAAIKALQAAAPQSIPTSTGPQTQTYEIDDSIFPNPERGLFTTSAGASPVPPTPWSPDASMTLEWVLLDLDEYRDKPLDQKILNALIARLGALRDTDAKAIFRARYTEEGDGLDAPLKIVLHHIDQLAPILNTYRDVLLTAQVGWAGSWGETGISKTASVNNLVRGSDKNGWALGQIIRHAHETMPEVFLGLRRADLAGPLDQPFSLPFGLFDQLFKPSMAFTNGLQGRVGFYNDCLGTPQQGSWEYNGDGLSAKQRRTILEAATLYTPTVGETCGLPSAASDDAEVLAFLERMHFDALHAAYSMPVIKGWSQGTRDTIARKLGYRYELLTTNAPVTVTPGKPFILNLTIRNSGWGSLYLPRPLLVMFTDTMGAVALADCRSSLPLPGMTRMLTLTVRAPAALPYKAIYRLGVKLPDPGLVLSGAGRCVRFANKNVWNASTGINDLGMSVTT